jgi:hypothetical protein
MTDRGQPNTLEEALQLAERDADAAIKALDAALKAAKKAKAAAALGLVRDLQQAMEAAVGLADQAGSTVRDIRQGWQFDVVEWFSSGDYAKELLAAAGEAGVQAFESDDRILCYPAILQVSATEAALLIDKKKDRRTRPSVVVGHLAALQQRPAKFKSDAFIETLAAAYDLVVASNGLRPGAPARLVDVHDVLTLLPGAARDYTRQEFARDMYLVDQSGKVDTKDGRRMSLPASAMTRSGAVLKTVTRTGQVKIYAGLAFTKPST